MVPRERLVADLRLQAATELRMIVEPPHARLVSVLFKLDGIDKAMRDLDRNCRRP